jgi:hypothetical protein
VEAMQGEGEVVCAGPCVEGRRWVVHDGRMKEQGRAPGWRGRGEGEGSEPVLRSSRDSAMVEG